MYGLEKKPPKRFEFDLEKDLKSDATKLQKTQKEVDAKVQEIKNLLRQGAASAEFDELGVILHAFTALQRVLNRLAKK